MEKYKLNRSIKAEDFYCSRCQKTKKSKNIAINEDGTKKICNGCYGLLLAKKEIKKIKS